MVKIRLTRQGAKKRPFYRIVAIDSRQARGGQPLEFLGTYDPLPKPEHVRLERERIEAWIAKGAQPSPMVRSLLRRQSTVVSRWLVMPQLSTDARCLSSSRWCSWTRAWCWLLQIASGLCSTQPSAG